MLLIANPAAGNGKVGRSWGRLLAEVRAVFPEIEGVLTTRPGEAAELADRAVAEGATTLLSLGGDGTHSEVASGIARRAPDGRVALGILHGGTGGDFSRLLGGGTVAEQAARLRGGEALAIDLGRVRFEDGSERVFLNEVSVGFGAALCRNVNAGSKWLGGTGTFLVQTARTLAGFVAQPIELIVDGRASRPGLTRTVVACNGQYGGGAMHLAPRARLADGALDVTVLKELPIVRSVPMAPRLYDGTLLEHPGVASDRGARIEVRSLGTPYLVEADGEVIGQTPVVIEVVPGALRLLGAPAAYL